MSIPKLKTLSKQVTTALYLEHRALIEEYWSTTALSPYLQAGCCSSVSAICLRSPHSHSPAQTHPGICGVEGEISLHFLIRQTCNRVIKISFLPSHSFTIKKHQPSVKISGSCHSHGYMWLSLVPISKENIPILPKYMYGLLPLPRLCKAAIKWGLK